MQATLTNDYPRLRHELTETNLLAPKPQSRKQILGGARLSTTPLQALCLGNRGFSYVRQTHLETHGVF